MQNATLFINFIFGPASGENPVQLQVGHVKMIASASLIEKIIGVILAKLSSIVLSKIKIDQIIFTIESRIDQIKLINIKFEKICEVRS